METYSLNPQILPGKPLSEHDHKKVRTTLIVAILIAAAIGIAFWLSISNKPAEVPVENPNAVRDEVLNFLASNQVHLTEAQINSVVSQLSASKVKVSEAERNNVISQLKK